MLYTHTFIICEIYENYNRNHKIIKIQCISITLLYDIAKNQFCINDFLQKFSHYLFHSTVSSFVNFP